MGFPEFQVCVIFVLCRWIFHPSLHVNGPPFLPKTSVSWSILIVSVSSYKWHIFVDGKMKNKKKNKKIHSKLFFKFSLPAVDIETNERCHFPEIQHSEWIFSNQNAFVRWEYHISLIILFIFSSKTREAHSVVRGYKTRPPPKIFFQKVVDKIK